MSTRTLAAALALVLAVPLPSVRAAETPARLFVVTRDPAGKPVASASVAIPALRLGRLTDEQGRGTIPGIPPGTYVVRWSEVGWFGDSARVRFEPGRVESLVAVLRPFERESGVQVYVSPPRLHEREAPITPPPGLAWWRADTCFLSTAAADLPPGEPVIVVLADSAARRFEMQVGEPVAWPAGTAPPVTIDGAEGVHTWRLEHAPGLDAALGPGLAILGPHGAVQLRRREILVDVNGDERPERFTHCASAEGVHFMLRSGATGALRWHAYLYLGYDLERDCTERDLRP